MNLTFPIADWLFGTSDLNRGPVGTLLNGYDTRFLKKTLRGKPLRPDEAAAAPVGANYEGFVAERQRCRTMSKPILSAIVLIVAAILSYWSGSPIRPDFSTFVMVIAVLMVAAMWVFPEAGVKKGDTKRAEVDSRMSCPAQAWHTSADAHAALLRASSALYSAISSRNALAMLGRVCSAAW